MGNEKFKQAYGEVWKYIRSGTLDVNNACFKVAKMYGISPYALMDSINKKINNKRG